MKTNLIGICAGLALLKTTLLPACGISSEIYAKLALSTNEATASNAVTALRSLGKEGLNALLSAHQQLIAKHSDEDPQWMRLHAALDTVGGQRDCHASRLFWHKN